MGNVLFLTHRLPYPPNKGDKVRTYHLLKYLAAGHRVFLGTFVDDPADRVHIERVRADCAGLHVAEIDPRLAKLGSLVGLATGEALTLPYYRDKGLRAWIGETCARERIDAAMIFSSAMMQYADAIDATTKLAVFDDVDSAKWTQYADNHRWPLSWLYRREGRKLLEFERGAAMAATCTFFVTDNEAALFASLAPECAGKLGVVCNGVDAEFFSPAHVSTSPFGPDELPIVFTGAMDYWPNVDAVAWFAAEVMPRLRRTWPQLRFYIVGRSPTAQVRALARADIVITGTVADVRPYLRHAALVVAPLRLARGIQNKILEAMAMGRAVVAAASCAGALDAAAGRDLLVAESAEDYAREVGRMLTDRERAAAIGVAARERVMARYSWDAHLAGFDPYLSAIPPKVTGGGARPNGPAQVDQQCEAA